MKVLKSLMVSQRKLTGNVKRVIWVSSGLRMFSWLKTKNIPWLNWVAGFRLNLRLLHP